MMADLFGCAIDETAPKVDVTESSSELVITATLTGIQKSDIKIELTDRFLTICAKRSDQASSNLHRTFPIEFATTPDRFRATLRNGMLKVVVPKAVAQHTIRIPVMAG